MSFGTNTILDKVSFTLKESEKAALVGVNGAGKSTLFKIIAGELRPDSGEVFTAKGLKIGCLEQSSGLDSDRTVWDEMLTAFSSLTSMEEKLKLLEKNISVEKDETRISEMIREYDSLLARFSREGGYEYNSRIRGVLKGLGFPEGQFDLPVSALSGGQKTRLALAKLLLSEPDLLLLDEPTNHLDITAIEWLEEFLKNFKKSVFVISHDRYFLDAVTTKTVELENFKCTVYNGSYSEYAKRKAEAREIQRRHYEQQQKEIARLEAFIKQQRRWNRERNIRAAESRQKAIDRMDKVEAPEKLPESISIKFKTGVKSGNDVLFIENLSKSYPGKDLFDNVSFDVKRQERVFIIGPNGCGKSTLLKILAGKIPATGGCVEYGHKVVLGYYDQELADLNEDNTVIEEVWNDNDELTHTQIRNTLARFLFMGEDVFKKIKVLSGGEKSRVALAKLMLSGANLLLLDEPTNHLDINSREALEEALLDYDGTIIAVSHDRYFIRKLATRIIEMAPSGIFDLKGDYAYYLEHRKTASEGVGSDSKAKTLSEAKLTHLASKEERARKRKLEKQLYECEKKISCAEQRCSEILEEMSRESVQSDHVLLAALYSEKEVLESSLESLYKTWEDLSEELSRFG